ERGEITEGTFNNVFVRRGDRWHTPPVACGLLPGIQRRRMLESREIQVVESVLRPADLAAADEIVLTNAIRGAVAVELPAGGRGKAEETARCCA
ncbi:MAG: aminotransferase class IV, partial [Polyangiaceae bacterium]|nr:aminotransferase class IV [Polyangiaceae bacterium]